MKNQKNNADNILNSKTFTNTLSDLEKELAFVEKRIIAILNNGMEEIEQKFLSKLSEKQRDLIDEKNGLIIIKEKKIETDFDDSMPDSEEESSSIYNEDLSSFE